MAYIDIFYSWEIFAACLIPVVLLLIRRVRRGAAEARRCTENAVPAARRHHLQSHATGTALLQGRREQKSATARGTFFPATRWHRDGVEPGRRCQ